MRELLACRIRGVWFTGDRMQLRRAMADRKRAYLAAHAGTARYSLARVPRLGDFDRRAKRYLQAGYPASLGLPAVEVVDGVGSYRTV